MLGSPLPHQLSEIDSPAKVPVFSWTNRDHLSLDAFDVKIHRIAGLLIVSQDMLLAQAYECCETDVEAGRRFLQRRYSSMTRSVNRRAIERENGKKGKGNILLEYRRSKHTRLCIFCHCSMRL